MIINFPNFHELNTVQMILIESKNIGYDASYKSTSGIIYFK